MLHRMNFRQGCMAAVIAYFILVVIFYYAAGEQLYIRESRNSIEAVQGDGITEEIAADVTVRQDFVCRMDWLERFQVKFCTFGRENEGNIRIQLYDQTAEQKLYELVCPVGNIADGQMADYVLDEPAPDVYGHLLSIILSAEDGNVGSSIAAWYTPGTFLEEAQLYLNGQAADGVLCFTAGGRDTVWTGPHYWQIAVTAGILLIVYCCILIYKKEHGMVSPVITAVSIMKRYAFLLRQLVARDFKIKYKRSVLGALWSFFNPLMTMGIQYIIFSQLFQRGVENYPVYLLSGVVLFGFFTESSDVSMYAVMGNASLIKKVYVPKYIYPLSKVLSTLVNLMIAMIPMLILTVLTGLPITKAWLLIPFVLVCLLLFCAGIGLLLSALVVFFRDIQFIWRVFLTAMNYMTPIFYPESILPDTVKAFMGWNPMYQYITFFRTIVIDGISPEPKSYAICLVISLLYLIAGAAVFKKFQDRFVFYI